ncbi:unnamed protein product [Chironomus riparius]|uniref:Odorant receptor n=1 Tax=Chironomus riparius TaxID=315576 RepID=A0A9N9RYF5_9DIPT|nr:unnamed protein product [Chironomus riparius]
MPAVEKVQNFLNLLKYKLKPARRSESVFIKFSDFFISEKIFNLYGLHNLPSSLSNDGSKKRKLLFQASIFSVAIFTVLSLISLKIGLTNDGSLLMLYENGIEFCVAAMIYIKTFLIAYYYCEKLKEVIEVLDLYYPNDGWNQQVFQVSGHLKTLKIHEILAILSYAIACSAFCFMPYFVQLYGLLTSQKFELDSILHFYLPIIDQNQLVVYAILNLIVLYAMYSGTVFTLMTDLLYVELVALASMELSNLGQLMSEIDPDDGMENAQKELERLTKVHEELIEVTRKLNEIFSIIMFIDLFGIIALMCLSAFMTFVSNCFSGYWNLVDIGILRLSNLSHTK